MHAEEIVARVVGPCLKCLHQRRGAALQRAVTGLLGNTALHRSREQLYRSVATQWLEGLHQLLVVVDWSDATRGQRWRLLRASAV